MTTHDTPSAGRPAAAVVPPAALVTAPQDGDDQPTAGAETDTDPDSGAATAASFLALALDATAGEDEDRDERDHARRLARQDRGMYLRMSEELRAAVGSVAGRWWQALVASWRPAVASELLDQLATTTGEPVDATADLRTPHGTAWPGSSDYHPDPGPAHPLTAAHTLLSAPGAPSLRGRAAAA